MCLPDSGKWKATVQRNQAAGIIPCTATFGLHHVMLFVYQFRLPPAKLSKFDIIQNMLWSFHGDYQDVSMYDCVALSCNFVSSDTAWINSLCVSYHSSAANTPLVNIESKADCKCKTIHANLRYLYPGPRLNIKTVLSTYGDFHVKDKTAVRTSYL